MIPSTLQPWYMYLLRNWQHACMCIMFSPLTAVPLDITKALARRRTEARGYDHLTRVQQDTLPKHWSVMWCMAMRLQDQELQLLSMDGRQERSWATEANVKYARMLGGPPGCESALVGCHDGTALQVFLAHAQPMLLLRHSCAIRQCPTATSLVYTSSVRARLSTTSTS